MAIRFRFMDVAGGPDRRRAAVSIAIALGLGLGQRASAESLLGIGLDVHGTDAALSARRPLGIAAAVCHRATQLSIVLDPLVFVLGWEVLDVTVGHWFADDRAQILVGWRQTSGASSAGRRYSEAALLGADVTMFASGPFRLSFGAELKLSLWRHGGAVPDETLRFAIPAELATEMEFLLHARFELVGRL